MLRRRVLGYPIFEMMFAAVLFVGLLFALLASMKGCAKALSGGLGFTAPLSNGYSVQSANDVDIVVAPDDGYDWRTPMIRETVVELDNDSTWVIAKQHPHYDAAISGAFDYWILNTKVPKVWGPLTEKE